MGSPKVDVAKMTPLLKSLVTLVGRRVDDSEVVAFVTKTLAQKKVPDSTTDAGGGKYVVAKKHGVDLYINHNIKNEQYPLIPKKGKAFIPYVQLAWIKPNFAEPLPFGVTHKMTVEEITKCLGVQTGTIGRDKDPCWRVMLDPTRDVVLGVTEGEIKIQIDEARELAASYHPSRQIVGLFLGWAIQRGLLDETKFAAHADLIAAIRKREKKGSDLIVAALPRGVWDVHLKDLPDLRDFARNWFKNLAGSYIVSDLIEVFKAREGPHGHDEPILDDDDWKAVDKATKALDKRFGAWVGK